MSAEFSDILGMLRHEKGISQRCAAADLGVSQALLSHYENGIREPGLPFVIKACKYYGVSADFLLGIDVVRGGETSVYKIIDDMQANDNPKVRLFANAIGLMLRVLEKVGDEELISEATIFTGCSTYILFRYLLKFNEQVELKLRVPEENVMELATIEMVNSLMRFKMQLNKLLHNSTELEYLKKYLESDFPMLCTQLSEIMEDLDIRMANHI